MAKAIKIVGAVALGAAAIVVTGGLAAGATLPMILGASSGVLGLSVGAFAALGAGLMSIGQSLDRKVPSTGAQSERLTLSIDPRAYRKTVFGRTAMATDVRYQEWFGADQEYSGLIVALASHRIESVDEIWIDDRLAWTSTGGVQGWCSGYFYVQNIRLEGSPSNTVVVSSPNAGKWNGAHRLTGCAYAHIQFRVTGINKKAQSPFASGVPSRITVIGKGALLYDPRFDGTVPGGSGAMRAADQSTWSYAPAGHEIGENLPLQILRVLLGYRIQNPETGAWRLATGCGQPASRIDLPSFIVAANIADEQANRSAGGTEPKFRGAGVVSEGDEPKGALDALCAACCARLRDVNGKISIAIMHNDLATAATDPGLTDDDVVGGFSWDPDPALDETPNVVRGKFTDASSSSLYQQLDYPEVRIDSPDGIDRVLPLDLVYVESPSQAQRVVKQTLQRKQYSRTFTSTFDITAWKYGVGDLVPFTFAPLAFTRKLFRVVATDPRSNPVPMTLQVEEAQIYAWDADDAPAVQAATPTVYDRGNNPLILAIGDLETAIGAAQGTADDAIDAIEALADDGVLTVNEKTTKLIPFNDQLEGAWAVLDAKAAAVGAPVGDVRTLAASARSAWQTYRDALSPGWSNTGFDTAVDRNVFNGKLNDYRFALDLLAAALIQAAANAAAGAQATADAAILGLEALADDGVLTVNEKVTRLVPLNDQLQGAWAVLDAQAATVGAPVATERSAAAAARSGWITYRNSLSPAWTDGGADTPVDRGTFDAVLNAYRFRVDALAAALTRSAASAAASAQGTADNAIDAIEALADDGVLSINEKITKLIPLDTQLEAAWTLLDAEAAAVGALVAGERATAAAARLAWLTYRNALSPTWNNIALDTAVDRATFDGKLSDYRYAIDALAPALTRSAAQTTSTPNRVSFSQWEAGVTGWAKRYDSDGTAGEPTVGSYDGKPYLNITFTPTAAGQRVSLGTANEYRFRVSPGERLAVFIGCNAYGPIGNVQPVIFYFDGSGAYLATTNLETRFGLLSYNTRCGGFSVVPAGAVTGVIEVYAMSSGAGAGAGLSITDPMVGQVSRETTVEPIFSVGPVPQIATPAVARTAHQVVAIAGADFMIAAADDHSITINPFTGTLDDQRVFSFPSDTITGLLAGTDHAVFCNLDTMTYLAVARPAAAEMADPTYAFLGYQLTSSSGSFAGLRPTPPRGYGGYQVQPFISGDE